MEVNRPPNTSTSCIGKGEMHLEQPALTDRRPPGPKGSWACKRPRHSVSAAPYRPRMGSNDHIPPAQPFPVLPHEECAITGCTAQDEHAGMLQVRLMGGGPHPPVRTVLRVGLCFQHAAGSHHGLEVHHFDQDAPHAITYAALCSVHRCYADAERPAALQGRLLGGYGHPPVEVGVELGLCLTHTLSSQYGLRPGVFTPPALGQRSQ